MNLFCFNLKAEDLDSEKSITYRLVAGDVDKFVINPETGEVSPYIMKRLKTITLVKIQSFFKNRGLNKYYILNYRSEQKTESVGQLASISKGPKLICSLSEQMKGEEVF